VEVHEVVTGERRWAHAAFEPQLVTAGSLTPPVLLDGRVFIAPALTQPPDRGGLLSLFADTGIVDWARDDDRVVPRGTPVVDRDVIVLPVGSQLLGFDRATGRRALVVETTIARSDVAADDGWLVAVDAPRDRGDLWVGRRATRDIVFRAPIRTCAPPVLHDDLVIVVDDLGDIVARRLEDGDQPWGERARGSACRPLAIAGAVLVAVVDDRELLAVTLADGETAWRLELPAPAAGAPVVAGDQVLVPTLAGEVVAYDVVGTAAPTAPAWRVAVDGVPAGAAAVDGDTVLVLTRAGELVALR
jgi:outer membrane protein assembly factor BamB